MEWSWLINNLTPRAALDILLVALMFFGASFLIRGTAAMTLLRGVVIVIGGVTIVANVFNLTGLRWLLNTALPFLVVALPVIFQPELRRVFERLGSAGIRLTPGMGEDARARLISDICQAVERLSERKHGALIVLERRSTLHEYRRTGVPLDGTITPQLLLTLFWPKTELHDGAVIVDQEGRIAAAAAVLPLSSTRNLSGPKLGTRHRAAIGISEVSDAVCIIVSEETGRISIANGGRLISRLDRERLQTILNALYGNERPTPASRLTRLLSLLRMLPAARRASDGRTGA